jgi:hypothetical protein
LQRVLLPARPNQAAQGEPVAVTSVRRTVYPPRHLVEEFENTPTPLSPIVHSEGAKKCHHYPSAAQLLTRRLNQQIQES